MEMLFHNRSTGHPQTFRRLFQPDGTAILQAFPQADTVTELGRDRAQVTTGEAALCYEFRSQMAVETSGRTK